MIPIESITGVIGTVLPITIKMLGKIFGKKDTQSPSEALDDIAITKPEILPQYTESLAKLLESKVKWFQRDVTEGVSSNIASFRAVIRPGVVVASLFLLFTDAIIFTLLNTHPVEEGVRAALTGYIGTWMGDRIDI